MVGPPGTGKTLLARAVAGEAEVPFLSVTGSAFVEMFVGVGASRVRDLFDEARKRAPSIVFIDEIDAIGGRRGGRGRGGNDEREQTLNQLLAEMDGFDQSRGIVVLAATNRPETLDPALLRPGRFDRQVVIPLPNQAERAAILAVHAAASIWRPTSTSTWSPGPPRASPAPTWPTSSTRRRSTRSAADRTIITAADLDAARDRVLLGRRETSNALLPEERHAVAVHESGHALLAALCEHADPVAKVTDPARRAWRSASPSNCPRPNGTSTARATSTDLLTVRLGGRAAELVVFGEGSTGAANDLAARHADRHPDGARVRPVPRARSGRLRRRPSVPRRGRRRSSAQAVLGADAAGHGRGGRPPDARGRGPGQWDPGEHRAACDACRTAGTAGDYRR